MIKVRDKNYFDDFTHFIGGAGEVDKIAHFIRRQDLITFTDDTGHTHTGYYKRTGRKTGMYVEIEFA